MQCDQHHYTLQSGGGSSSNKEASTKETKTEENKKSAGKESKSSASNKGGWFSSLLGWKSSTPQAVLPDDKNPKVSLSANVPQMHIFYVNTVNS